MPRVSVVIPTFNNARFLTSCLESVFRQTNQDYEVVVIDDGSTDDTETVLRPFSSQIRYIYQDNQGLAVARNVGLENSRGEYITYLDADDLWMQENLEIKCRILEMRSDLGGVCSDFVVFDDSGTITETGTYWVFPVFRRTGKQLSQLFPKESRFPCGGGSDITMLHGHVFESLFMGNFILPSSMVFRRSCGEQVGRFVPWMRTQQDYEYWLRFSRRFPIGYVDKPLVRYRRHSQQLTDHTNIEKIFDTLLEIVDKYEDEHVSRGWAAVFRKRKAELLRDLAKVYIRKNGSRKARRTLREAIRLNPADLSEYLLYVVSLCPPRAIRAIHGLSKRLSCRSAARYV